MAKALLLILSMADRRAARRAVRFGVSVSSAIRWNEQRRKRGAIRAVSVEIESGFPRGAERRSLGGRFGFWDAP